MLRIARAVLFTVVSCMLLFGCAPFATSKRDRVLLFEAEAFSDSQVG